MILMLTKHPSHSFSCLTPYICVCCRNEENELKSKRFGQELRKFCKEEVVVATIGQSKRKSVQQSVMTIASSATNVSSTFSVWL